MTSISASAVNAMTLLSWAAYRQDGDATAGENDLAAGLVGSGWTIVRPSQLGMSTLDPDNEYFEVRVGSSSGPVAAAFLAQRDGALAIAFRGSDETGDLLATISNQSGYFNAYRNFLDAALLYAADPANGVTQIFVTGHSLGGVMAEWFANDYALEVSALELPVSIATFGSPGTDIASPPTALAQSIVHFGHTGDQIFKHTGSVGGFLTGLVREGTSIEIDLPNVDANDPRLNFFEHDMFLYQRSAPVLANSYFGQRLMDAPTSHQIIVDTVIAAQDDQVTLNFSTRSVPLAMIGDSGVIAPGFADVDIIWGGSAGDWIDGGRGNDTLLGGGGNDEFFGGTGADFLTGGSSSDRYVFDSFAYNDARAAIPLVDHITDFDQGNSGTYNAAEGDQIDLSALLSTAFGAGQTIDSLAWAIEDPSGTFALLQIDTDGTANGAHWVTIAQLDGLSVGNSVNVIPSSSQPAGGMITVASTASTANVLNDFDGDGRSDILWRNDNGTVHIWEMNGFQVQAANNVAAPPNTWHIAGTGDFDADGRDDILWRHDDGTVGIWELNGFQILAANNVAAPPNDWHIESTGDFDGDGRGDILWRHDNGTVGMWELNGFQIQAANNVGAAGNTWHITGTGDFNGDGRGDVLWRHDNGTVGIWELNGFQLQAANNVAAPANDWHIEGTGDFNADGRDDILWRHNDGTVGIWELNGFQILAANNVAAPPNDWHIESTGDYNADGRDDILWRHDGGTVGIWELNGFQILAANNAGALTNDWHIVA
jgi:hypothetical protein